jgi:hypothetical protein
MGVAFGLLLCLCGTQVYGQTDAAREYIRARTNVESLEQKAVEWRIRDSLRYVEAVDKAKEKGWPVRTVDSNRITEIAFLDERGMPVYRTTTNTDAAISTQTDLVHSGGGAGYDLNGEMMTVGEWDGGAVLGTHEILTGRVTQMDTPAGNSDHATHVAGTLIGDEGGDPSAKGMAPEASLHAYDWNSDNAEMAAEAADGLLISNHSYGFITGWAYGSWSGSTGWHWWGDADISTTEDSDFGRYSRIGWDDMSYDAPYYLIVKSAGNDRGQGPSPGTSHYYYEPDSASWIQSSASREKDGGPDGFDCISFYGISKNILSIGAVNDVLSYNGPNDVTMSSFSGWGPADDGRIKPDLVGNGVLLFSSTKETNSSYGNSSGTSMSGPNVAGSLLLLQQLYMELNNDEVMRSATLKGLAIHTARPAGDGPAPDYEFGWGLLSTSDAADLISDASGNDSLLMELSLADGATESFTYISDGTEPLKVTICWTDPPGTTKSGLNNREPALVNDLDLRIEHDGTTYEPYVLDVENPAAAATNGDDTVNNVEQIYIEDPTAGEYVVTISHKGSIVDTQAVSMITSGFDLQLLPIEWLAIRAEAVPEGHHISWEAVTEQVQSMEVQQWRGEDFVTIGTQRPLNDKGPQSYSYLNREPQGEAPFIYRIRSVDFDGTESYSRYVMVHESTTPAAEITVFPNPARSHWRVRSSQPISDMELRDNRGQLIREWSGDCPSVIAASALSAGTYYLRLKTDEEDWSIYPLIKVE